MYARIATFEGLKPELRETMERFAREQWIPETRRLPGYAGYVDLGESTGRAVSILLFDNEEHARAGDVELDRQSPPPELGAVRRTSRELFEVVVHELPETAAAARITRVEGAPERIDEGKRVSEEQILPEARRMEGWRGVISCADRTTGAGVLVTFWDSVDAMKRSEQQADSLRTRSADAGGQQITSVERYEVVAIETKIPAIH